MPRVTGQPLAGPWYVERPHGEPGLYVSAKPSTALVCRVYDEYDARAKAFNETPEATAALLAAAPKLLTAAERISEAANNGRDLCLSDLNALRSAISAARCVSAEVKARS